MRDPDFDISIDFNRLMDLCLNGVSTFLFGMNKDISNEKVFICETLEVWAACSIQTGRDLGWERKPEHLEEDTVVHNLSELII